MAHLCLNFERVAYLSFNPLITNWCNLYNKFERLRYLIHESQPLVARAQRGNNMMIL